MVDTSSIRQASGLAAQARVTGPMFRLRGATRIVALGAFVGCAQLLDIPSDPEVVPPPPAPVQAQSASGEEVAASPSAPGSSDGSVDGSVDAGAPSSEGVVPSPSFLGSKPDEPGSPPAGPPALRPDGGALESGDDGVLEPLPEDACDDGFERVPIDVLFIVDNSAGMSAAAARFEDALPTFAGVLDAEEVDYRLILLSRHRQGARDADELSATAICVEAPLSGLEDCPSERPALGPRFFPYSISIPTLGSFDQVLAAFSQPDLFGLTSVGWSEWLRLGSRKVFIEISDGDSTLIGSEFVSALAGASSQHFSADIDNPGFVFHSIIGASQKRDALDIYQPDEPIEPGLCAGDGTNPANAGEVFQELSRSTGGLRQSICPATVMGLRLQVLALDVIRRSFAACD
jgi:hypothetical protein